MRLLSARGAALALVIAALAIACGGRQRVVGGTRIPDTALNRGILDAVEAYRQAVERRDASALLLMAAPSYHEDSGTIGVKDDYGITKLKTVLETRFQKADDIRYSMRYVAIHHACPGGRSRDDLAPGCRALVEVLLDASFTVVDARDQERRPDKRDQNLLELEWTCGADKATCKWMFVSGM